MDVKMSIRASFLYLHPLYTTHPRRFPRITLHATTIQPRIQIPLGVSSVPGTTPCCLPLQAGTNCIQCTIQAQLHLIIALVADTCGRCGHDMHNGLWGK